MNIGIIIVIIYFAIGFICSYKWYKEDYEESYNESVKNGVGVEKGMVNLLLLYMVVFWLPILIYKFYKAYVTP